MLRTLLFSLLYLTLGTAVFAQGDECAEAFRITDVADYCSSSAEFTTDRATRGAVLDACVPGSRSADVWFKFIAEQAGVAFKVEDDTRTTLRRPQFVLYSGSCDNLSPIGCGLTSSSSITSFIITTLQPGEEYFLRVFGQNNSTGSFNLCIRSFVPGPEPTSDCVIAKRLCGIPTGFIVNSLAGAGNDQNEVPGSSCLRGSESQSVWYTFTAANDGDLVFALIPDLGIGDLDFLVFELTGATPSCANKTVLRCSASGGRGCQGPTGLRFGARDLDEASGCAAGQDNWLAPLRTVTGKTYALAINNYDPDNPGFRIDFAGSTTQFTGPVADFGSEVVENTCETVLVAFTTSDTPGVDYLWNFGPGSSPETATSPQASVLFVGPAGPRFITLTATLGDCAVSITRRINVNVSEAFEPSATTTPVTCAGENSGQATIRVAPATGIFTFTLTRIDSNATGLFTGLLAGTYTVSVQRDGDPAACAKTVSFTVESESSNPLALFTISTDTLVCENSRFSFLATGDDADATYSWTFGAEATPTSATGRGPHFVDYQGTGSSLATLSVQRENCEASTTQTVNYSAAASFEVSFEFTSPNCTDPASGTVTVMVSPPGDYRYQLGTDSEQRGGTYTGLRAGDYQVGVRPAGARLACQLLVDFTIEDAENEPPDLSSLRSTPTSCPNASDGQVELDLLPGHLAQLDGGIGRASGIFRGLSAGTYRLLVTSANGCSSQENVIVAAGNDPFSIGELIVRPTSCPGAQDGSLQTAGLPGLIYSLDDVPLADTARTDQLPSGPYTLRVSNETGCTVDTSFVVPTLDGPTVDLGSDRTAGFGDTLTLRPNYAPTNPVIESFRYTGVDSTGTLRATAAQLTFRPTAATQFITLTIVDAAGCTATDTLLVTVIVTKKFEQPTAFSPNGDGVNDRFYLVGSPAVSQILEFSIFDRWGNLLYTLRDFPPNDPKFGWDGRRNDQALDSGTFVYLARVRFIDETEATYAGDVTLFAGD